MLSRRKLQTLLQSYQNVSNSQLCNYVRYFKQGCKRFCKVIKMLAIHNMVQMIILMEVAANAFAKLSKCQQFTTHCTINLYTTKLQTLLQSYQNVSNSQLCNHNIFRYNAANAFAKLSKCQQFTTRLYLTISTLQLQTLLQSYQNVSNSQRIFHLPKQYISCKRFCKVIKMLAIHNQ